MPRNSKVHKIYAAIKRKEKRKGLSERAASAKAARIAQANTGRSLATNKKLKKKRKR